MGPLIWRILGLAIAGYILYDSYKRQRLSEGVFWALMSAFMPIVGIFYFILRPKPSRISPTIQGKSKFCSKCGTKNSPSATHCSNCKNALTL